VPSDSGTDLGGADLAPDISTDLGPDIALDGLTDAACAGDASRSCYTGAAGTKGVGECKVGTQTCAGGAWGACVGDVKPAAETCDNKDNDCDGTRDNGLTRACYSGAAATKGVGECKGGTQTCTAGVWGACAGEVTPKAEICDNKDNDCDGTKDDSVSQYCYTGKAGTKGIGLCKAGLQLCAAGKWGPCAGEVTPKAEVCDTFDNDCDGTKDNGLTQACYTGKAGTEGVGLCKGGTRTCAAGKWGSCVGEIVPKAEVCDTFDNDCDGAKDNGLTQACYTGKAGTQGIGLCKGGTRTCAAGKWGSCAGEVTPKAEVCDTHDNDCDGTKDNGNPCAEGTLCSKGTCAALSSCKEIKAKGTGNTDGVYKIDPDGSGAVAPFKVYCDQTAQGGGWTLIAKMVPGPSAWNLGTKPFGAKPILETSSGSNSVGGPNVPTFTTFKVSVAASRSKYVIFKDKKVYLSKGLVKNNHSGACYGNGTDFMTPAYSIFQANTIGWKERGRYGFASKAVTPDMFSVFGHAANFQGACKGGSHDHTCFMHNKCESTPATDCVVLKGTAPKTRWPQWGPDGCKVAGHGAYWVR